MNMRKYPTSNNQVVEGEYKSHQLVTRTRLHAVMDTKHTSPPPPQPSQSSQQGTVGAGDDFEVTECIAYSTTTHGPLPPTLPVETAN